MEACQSEADGGNSCEWEIAVSRSSPQLSELAIIAMGQIPQPTSGEGVRALGRVRSGSQADPVEISGFMEMTKQNTTTTDD